MKKSAKKIVVAVSGGFDPLHIGHVRLFEAAHKLGDELVVILNNDNWLRAKKGYVFMQEKERKEIIEALRSVSKVIVTSHLKDPKDMSVADDLRRIKPDIFANGGDRKSHNTPEDAVCRELGIKMAFNKGRGGKVQSSSWLVEVFQTREK
ncbi:MAG: adenylyltransferase/cytidyltransferase family protein [bacterium]|nr:adenylyltransferase/cytidyltransferase family protein [bacterium]